MRGIITLAGLVLILFGIFTFAYQNISFTQEEEVAQIGNVEITADTQKTLYFPPLLSGLCLAGGIVLVIVGRMGRK